MCRIIAPIDPSFTVCALHHGRLGVRPGRDEQAFERSRCTSQHSEVAKEVASRHPKAQSAIIEPVAFTQIAIPVANITTVDADNIE